jgi:hypothetical protein
MGAGSNGPVVKVERDVRMLLYVLGALIGIYLVAAYLVAPTLWKRASRRHPALSEAPSVCQTPSGIPGDALNIALVGLEDHTVESMLLAGWHPADAITLKSSIRIAKSTLFHKPYEDAPVSTLLLFGRKQDYAFEEEVGKDARERHHVRFWRTETLDELGRAAWMGAATFDRSVGLSRTTGQVTHHIGAEIDLERDKIIQDLERVGQVEEVYWIDDFHAKKEGKNGGGDRYTTDGRLAVVVLHSPAN